MAIEKKRAVYLLSNDAERFPGLEVKDLKQPIKEFFKSQPSPVSVALSGELKELFLQLFKCLRSPLLLVGSHLMRSIESPLRNSTVPQKTRNDSLAFLFHRSRFDIVKHVAHELADHAIFFLLPECP
jgi:hypothetical protein